MLRASEAMPRKVTLTIEIMVIIMTSIIEEITVRHMVHMDKDIYQTKKKKGSESYIGNWIKPNGEHGEMVL